MKIAVYGGSFNPPHLGHVEAARTVSAELAPDKFLIIPTNISPHKEMAAGSPTPQERLEMCRLAFADIPGAEVSDMELQREGKSYTAQTVEELRREYPEDEIILVMGTDMLLSFESWYRFEYLLDACSLAVLSRDEDEELPIERQRAYLEERYGARITVMKHDPVVASSCDIRERLRFGLGAELLPDGVYSMIIRRHFYDAKPELSWLRAKVMPYLTEKRVAHVLGCENEAVALANRWGEDPERAAVAGILHDITKRLSAEEQLKLCEKYGIINDAAEVANPKLLHAKTGAALARDLFGIEDDIYGAIRWHTTGKPDMTLLEKIIYLADYVEPNRSFPGLEELRELCFEDIDAAMAKGLEMSLAFIRAEGAEPYKDSVEACEWYAALINN